MAASLLRRTGWVKFGKVLQLEEVGLKVLPASMLLCTKSGDPKKEPTKKSAEQALDNSIYKNMQHHSYTLYTFVDFDVQLEKLRQPQPSSGRSSPRH